MSEHEEKELPPEEPASPEGLSDEDFSSLLNSINTVAPLLHGLNGILGGKRSDACTKRETFLLSLKPYLSPMRCEAVDYLVRIGRIGDALRTLR